MKKNGLTLAVAAGLLTAGGIADAVHVNPDGTGEALIYPYYTVRAEQQSHISIVNTAAVGKAVKVRVLEGRNSREVLDFNVYMSPYDVWTASIGEVAPGSGAFHAGGAALLTTDRTCTVPDFVRSGDDRYLALGLQVSPGGGTVCEYDVGLTPDNDVYVAFRPFAFMPDRYPPMFTVANGGVSYENCVANINPTLNERTKEGYIEIINMGDIVTGSSTYAWSLHNAAGEPPGCHRIAEHWAQRCYQTGAACSGAGYLGNPVGNLAGDVTLGTGGLFGNAHITNAARGTVFGYTADALDNVLSRVWHTNPGELEPNLDRVEDFAGAGYATAQVFANGRLINARYDEVIDPATGNTVARKIDAISALFATRRISNEFYLDNDDAIRAQSEWVVTFPTKRHYVDNNPTYDWDAPGGIGAPFINPAPLAPFTQAFVANGACEPVTITVYNREERTISNCDSWPPPPQCSFSPPRPGSSGTALCWESQVITFNQPGVLTGASNILGATYAENITTGFKNGWANINFPHANHRLRPAANGSVFRGLPVTGFFVSNLDNSNQAGGILANYSMLFHHRTQRECVRNPGANEIPCS